jgi:hypothetical protein
MSYLTWETTRLRLSHDWQQQASYWRCNPVPFGVALIRSRTSKKPKIMSEAGKDLEEAEDYAGSW